MGFIFFDFKVETRSRNCCDERIDIKRTSFIDLRSPRIFRAEDLQKLELEICRLTDVNPVVFKVFLHESLIKIYFKKYPPPPPSHTQNFTSTHLNHLLMDFIS
jgi:hypothetical protein